MEILARVLFRSSKRLYSIEERSEEDVVQGVLLTVCVGMLPVGDVAVLLTVAAFWIRG